MPDESERGTDNDADSASQSEPETDGGGGKSTDVPGAEWPDPPPKWRSRLRSPRTPLPPRGRGGSFGKGSGDGEGRRIHWRFIAYAVFLLYLAGDLLIFRGPLKQRIENRRAFTATAAEKASSNGWVATVNGEPVTIERLDRAVDVHLHQRGKVHSELSDATLYYVRGAVLQNLIDDLLVEQHAAGRDHTVSEAKVDTAVARFESQFKDAARLEQRSATQHLDAGERRQRLRELVVQVDWLESHLAATPQVTESMARRWFEDNRTSGIGNGFGVEEAARVRHIFLSTLGGATAEREQQIRELHRQLTQADEPADFAALASKHSEDQRSKAAGGDLNWFTRKRMPAEFFAAIEGLAPGDISAPFRSSLGWHIVQLTERRPPREAGFEDMRDEIIAYLESEDRRQKIDEFLGNLRRASVIQVFREQL